MLQDGGTRYVMGPDGLPLEQVGVTGTVLYYYQDQLGSTRALLNGAGQGVAAYAYNAFGTVAYKTGSATNPFGYAGQYTDSETGFQYLQARYYDPATSQFLTRDPLVNMTGQPYAYADDDPVNESDPTGFFGNCPGLDFASPIGNHACTGPLSAATLWVASHFPSQAHQVAVQARTANQQATQWVQTTPSGRLFNNMVIQPVCTLQDPYATRQEKANAAFDLAMLGSGPFGGELGALGDVGDVGAAGSDAGRILDAGGDAGAGQTAIGFSQDTVTTAYQGMRSGGGHAMRHLIDEGLIPNSGSLVSRASTFERLTSPILTNPVRTFDWKLGSTLSRAFAGVVNGTRVVVFVAKEGPYEGRVLSAVVPDANQVAQWGLP